MLVQYTHVGGKGNSHADAIARGQPIDDPPAASPRMPATIKDTIISGDDEWIIVTQPVRDDDNVSSSSQDSLPSLLESSDDDNDEGKNTTNGMEELEAKAWMTNMAALHMFNYIDDILVTTDRTRCDNDRKAHRARRDNTEGHSHICANEDDGACACEDGDIL
jgi:hypothetical protein